MVGPLFSQGGSSRRYASLKSTYAKGHLPSKRLGIAPTRANLEELKQALTEAIQTEDYVQAARVRDAIASLPEKQQLSQRAALEAELKEAVVREDFAAAASVRDQLAQLPPETSTRSDGLTHISEAVTCGVAVKAISAYVPQRSAPDKGRYFFVYKIRIENRSNQVVQLRNRKWVITDAHQHEEEVRGPGVIGQQPILLPGKQFEYMSACPLKTSSGFMEGEYECIVLDEEGEWGETLAVKIARFKLTTSSVADTTL